ncbi:MAG: amidohydrolase family protein [Kangiellaceae bacterium]|nr:amidohydrolase family protein [Kangiellaceae bacterium]
MKKLKTLIIFFLSFSFQVQSDPANDVWLLEDVSLIDMQTGTVHKKARILFKNGLIESINPSKVQPSAIRISGNGRWVIPGLSEMHAHITGTPKYTDRILNLFIAHGVTNIRGMLGQPEHLKLREHLNTGKKLGPYLVTSGPSVNGNSVKTPKEAIKKITAQVKAGYDFHKIHPGLSKESYKAVVETAKELNSSWAGHISAEVGIIETVRAGQATIDHLDGFIEELAVRSGGELTNRGFFGFALAEHVKDEAIGKLVKELSTHNYALVPTETLMFNFATDKPTAELLKNPAHKWMPSNVVNNWKNSRESFWNNDGVTPARAKRFLEVRAKLLKEFQAQGTPILLGSDAPQVFNVPGDAIHKELSLMVDAGLTPLQALQTGTINVNRFYQGKHLVGKIAKGMRADLVLLNNNPLENIKHTRDIHAVVIGGKLLDRAELDRILKALE